MLHRSFAAARSSAIARGGIVVALIGTIVVPSITAAQVEAVTGTGALQLIEVTNLQTRDGVVTGTVVNKSGDTLRNVKLMIDHAWLWKNERHPGSNNPARTDAYVVPGPIPPRSSVAFEYPIAPALPARHDGHFRTRVSIADFTQVGPQQFAR
jgi:hypothetical protein